MNFHCSQTKLQTAKRLVYVSNRWRNADLRKKRMQFRKTALCGVCHTIHWSPNQITSRCTRIIGSVSTHDFETRTASGSELFSLITRLHTITFTMLTEYVSQLGMISIKSWETPLSWHTECSFPVAVRVSKMRVLKLPNFRRDNGKL